MAVGVIIRAGLSSATVWLAALADIRVMPLSTSIAERRRLFSRHPHHGLSRAAFSTTPGRRPNEGVGVELQLRPRRISVRCASCVSIAPPRWVELSSARSTSLIAQGRRQCEFCAWQGSAARIRAAAYAVTMTEAGGAVWENSPSQMVSLAVTRSGPTLLDAIVSTSALRQRRGAWRIRPGSPAAEGMRFSGSLLLQPSESDLGSRCPGKGSRGALLAEQFAGSDGTPSGEAYRLRPSCGGRPLRPTSSVTLVCCPNLQFPQSFGRWSAARGGHGR